MGPVTFTSDVPPLALCTGNLNTNLLSLNDHCVVIEECETQLYRLLHDDLGFDVITCPLRVLNEFGGGVHCGKRHFIYKNIFYYFLYSFHIVTWDIRRQDSCVDYFPNQNYEIECQIDLDNYFDEAIFSQNDS